MKAQIFITDFIFVAVYYLAIIPIWYGVGGNPGLGTLVAQYMQNTPWSWIVTVINIIVIIAPLIWLLNKMLWARLLAGQIQ